MNACSTIFCLNSGLFFWAAVLDRQFQNRFDLVPGNAHPLALVPLYEHDAFQCGNVAIDVVFVAPLQVFRKRIYLRRLNGMTLLSEPPLTILGKFRKNGNWVCPVPYATNGYCPLVAAVVSFG